MTKLPGFSEMEEIPLPELLNRDNRKGFYLRICAVLLVLIIFVSLAIII